LEAITGSIGTIDKDSMLPKSNVRLCTGNFVAECGGD
jgi:hypothetical protein